MRRRAALLALLLATPLGCGERAPRADDDAAAAPPAGTPAAEDSLYPAEVEPGIALAVRKLGSRTYMLYGRTDRAALLELSVEDGHNVLFGPEVVPVENERFRIDLVTEPSDRSHVFFYIATREGERLAVVPVDTARELTTAGPAAALPELPSPP